MWRMIVFGLFLFLGTLIAPGASPAEQAKGLEHTHPILERGAEHWIGRGVFVEGDYLYSVGVSGFQFEPGPGRGAAAERAVTSLASYCMEFHVSATERGGVELHGQMREEKFRLTGVETLAFHFVPEGRGGYWYALAAIARRQLKEICPAEREKVPPQR